jgi:uncharacterized protein (TIGR03083 family)
VFEHQDPIHLVTDEESRLAQELKNLTHTVWAKPSQCEGWSNLHVLAHLIAGAELYADSVTRALNDDAAPPTGPDGQAIPPDTFPLLLPQRQDALTREQPPQLLDRFSASGQQLATLYRSLSPTDRDRPAWHPRGVLTIGTLVVFRLYELAFHGWDIRAPLDAEAEIRPALRPFLVSMVRQFQASRSQPDAHLSGACRFDVDNHTWTVQVHEGALAEAPDQPTARATIRTDASTYLLLATGRRTPAERMERISLQGDSHWAEQLLSTMPFRV